MKNLKKSSIETLNSSERTNQVSINAEAKAEASIEQLNNKKMSKEFTLAKKEVATSKAMKTQIMEKTETGYTFKEENRKFGLVKENRPIKKTDVNGFLQIIQNGKYDDTQSIVTAEATELVNNCNIVDLEGNPISEQDAKDYLIVLDGQHRIVAFSKLNAIKKPENQILIPNVHIKTGLESVRGYLADINMVGHNWSTADKVCVSAISTESKLLAKVRELIKEGFNTTTAVLICTGKRISTKDLKKMISEGNTNCLPDEESTLKKAEEFLTTAWSILDMTTQMLTKRYFIKGFNSFAASRTHEEALTALGKLTFDDFKATTEDNEFIEKLKAALEA